MDGQYQSRKARADQVGPCIPAPVLPKLDKENRSQEEGGEEQAKRRQHKGVGRALADKQCRGCAGELLGKAAGTAGTSPPTLAESAAPMQTNVARDSATPPSAPASWCRSSLTAPRRSRPGKQVPCPRNPTSRHQGRPEERGIGPVRVIRTKGSVDAVGAFGPVQVKEALPPNLRNSNLKAEPVGGIGEVSIHGRTVEALTVAPAAQRERNVAVKLHLLRRGDLNLCHRRLGRRNLGRWRVTEPLIGRRPQCDRSRSKPVQVCLFGIAKGAHPCSRPIRFRMSFQKA